MNPLTEVIKREHILDNRIVYVHGAVSHPVETVCTDAVLAPSRRLTSIMLRKEMAP